jgi:hypothetical protein
MFFALLFNDDRKKWMILWPAWPDAEEARERARAAAKFHGLDPDKHAKVLRVTPWPFAERIKDFKFKEIKKGE